MKQQVEEQKLDIEWIRLIREAKKMGLKIDDIRMYLRNITK